MASMIMCRLPIQRPCGQPVSRWKAGIDLAPRRRAQIRYSASFNRFHLIHLLRCFTQGNTLFYNIANTSGFISMTQEVGVWHHVALAFDTVADLAYLYVDGVQRVMANASNVNYGSFPLVIGAEQTSATTFANFFHGSIDEFRVYDRALTSAEVRNQYSQYAATRMVQSAGTATIGGSLTGSPAVTLSGGKTTRNGYSLATLNQIGGQLAPGNSPGCLTIDGNYSLAVAGSLQVEVDGASVCTQYDQLRVNGSVSLAGALDFVLAPTYAPSIGTLFTIIENDGADAIVGQFTGLPERQVFIANGTELFQITYRGGTGNDVVLKYLGSGVIVSTTAVVGAGSLVEAITTTNSRRVRS